MSPPSRHCDGLLALGDNVTVIPVSQPSVEVSINIAHGEEAPVSPGESEHIRPAHPVADPGAEDSVGELDHVANTGPPVFTGPASTTVSVRGSVGRTRVCVREVVAGHDSLEPVVVSQHEARPDLVVPGILVCQETAPTTMTSLVVVVINEHQG